MFYILSFIIWLLFGSFGSVILHRLKDGITRPRIRSILVGRSECPHCHHMLARYDLFPLISWLVTWGKCRYCKTTVSKWYPLLELWCGLVFLGTFYRWSLYGGGDRGLLAISLLLNWSFYMLMVHDIDTMYLHEAAYWLACAGGALLLFYQTTIETFLAAAMRIFVFTAGFLFIYWLAKVYVRLRFKQSGEGIGQWDVMLAPIIGVIMRKLDMIFSGGMPIDRYTIIQMFRYYVIIACVAAVLLLIITPITKEEGKRLIPFFPGMILSIWILMFAWQLIMWML